MESSAAKELKLFSSRVVRDINGVKESGFLLWMKLPMWRIKLEWHNGGAIIFVLSGNKVDGSSYVVMNESMHSSALHPLRFRSLITKSHVWRLAAIVLHNALSLLSDQLTFLLHEHQHNSPSFNYITQNLKQSTVFLLFFSSHDKVSYSCRSGSFVELTG